jgi:nucleoside 2-deoxyribosyltransferase
MKLVYIAGPYCADTAWAVEKNVRAAETLAHSVWLAGYVAVCPHSMCRWMSEIDESVYLEGLLDLMRHCDAVLLVGAWAESRGTVAEVLEARRLGIPVYLTLADLLMCAGARSARQAAVQP